MNKLIVIGFTASSLLASVIANAAQTADLTLTGTFEPASCTPTFPGGATVDYGNIAASSLKKDATNPLGAKNTTFNVTCNAPAKFYLRITDNKADSIASDVGAAGSIYYGLGKTSKGGTIGAWTLAMNTPTATTGAPRLLASSDSGVTWVSSSGLTRAGTVQYTWGDGATSLTPGSFTSLTTNLVITATLAKGSNLPLADSTKLDGSATISVFLL